mmetsp:Transcript_4119/g.8056  ORF Transcript_4119/g.8056 Transcript_4119/m.8056 type:complete len:109 (+) Transcript_4119:1001-1327(+)
MVWIFALVFVPVYLLHSAPLPRPSGAIPSLRSHCLQKKEKREGRGSDEAVKQENDTGDGGVRVVHLSNYLSFPSMHQCVLTPLPSLPLAVMLLFCNCLSSSSAAGRCI